MSILDKVVKINNGILKKDFYKLICLEALIGHVHYTVAKELEKEFKEIVIKNSCIFLLCNEFYQLNRLIKNISKYLEKRNFIKPLTGELFSCVKSFGGKEYFLVDRSVLPALGIRGYGIHMIAYLNTSRGPNIWIPTRSKNKLIDPGKLDNTVAGGIKARESVFEALSREAYEEASINGSLIKNAKAVGTVNYCLRDNISLRPDLLFIYELEVEKDFIPKCRDREVQNFKLMHWSLILDLLRNTNDFKINCGLVLVDFCIRHGLINYENEKDYEFISSSLRTGHQFNQDK